MTQAHSPVEVTAPEPDLAGTFAMFEKPTGGMVFMIRFRGEDGERRWDVPPIMARRARGVLQRFMADGRET